MDDALNSQYAQPVGHSKEEKHRKLRHSASPRLAIMNKFDLTV